MEAAGASGTAQARVLALERGDDVETGRARAVVEDRGNVEGRRRGRRGNGGLVAGERAGVE